MRGSLAARVAALEKSQTQSSENLARVVFTDGSAKSLQLPDVIPFLLAEKRIVSDVVGEATGQGLLLDLIKGLL